MTKELHWKSAREIRDAVQSGAVSATQIAQEHLTRIDAVDGRVDAFTQLWRDKALEMAAAVDAKAARGETLGALAGVPVGLKELFCTRHGKTSCASKMLENFESPYDATVVKKLEEADAVFLGKVNMDEFAMGSSTENSAIKTTKNPWNLKCVPGGSSGGSAAAVTAGECALSLGSDTGGSIRQPACLCGCVGIKPTYGRVSRYGLVAFASSLDQVGPLTRTVEDAALTLDVICGKDVMDATSAVLPKTDFMGALTGDISGLRVGLPREYFTDALNPEMREKVECAIDVYRANGAEIVDVSLPCSDYAIAVYYIICTAEASANLARFDGVRYGFRHPDAKTVKDMYALSKSDAFGPEVQRRIMLGTYVLSSGYYDAYYLKAQKVRALIKKDFDAAFEKCDVIASPTSPTASFEFGSKSDNPLEMYLSDIYTISVNLATLPGISVPCGLTDAGLPAGLQLIGRPFEEDTLLRAAHFYEQNRGFDMGRPPVA
ncbi:MAG: Asp-tRNA(Asn)/Glu-tRNA(Gln) amidotransferase subunit GatA [Candidatus Hydrogenedentes bacterium]|nr:Asp-tRNA(Asn)/Glu-tRNA(Gln) amidotransferase subunit GatA [Candidatus Hydrogenedentota bacterium]